MSNKFTNKVPSGQNLFVLIALVLGIGAGLFGLNYYHALNCTNVTEEKQTHTEALDRRLKRAEAQLLKNNAFLERMKSALQDRLLVIDATELSEIVRISEDEAIRIALKSATYPAPPKPDFEEDYFSKEDDKKSKFDDFFWREAGGKESSSSSSGGRDDWSSYKEGSKERDEYHVDDYKAATNAPKLSITDAEATKACNEWKSQYAVSVGVSWGSLPYDLQKKWLEYSCDYHLLDADPSSSASSNSGDIQSNSAGDTIESAKDDDYKKKENDPFALDGGAEKKAKVDDDKII